MISDVKSGEGVWLGLLRCGCVETVIKDGADAATVDWEKQACLARGLSVLFVLRQAWERDYLPGFLDDCPHQASSDATPRADKEIG